MRKESSQTPKQHSPSQKSLHSITAFNLQPILKNTRIGPDVNIHYIHRYTHTHVHACMHACIPSHARKICLSAMYNDTTRKSNRLEVSHMHEPPFKETFGQRANRQSGSSAGGFHNHPSRQESRPLATAPHTPPNVYTGVNPWSVSPQEPLFGCGGVWGA